MKGLFIKEFLNDKWLICIGIISFVASVGNLSTGIIMKNISSIFIVLYIFTMVMSFSLSLDRNAKWDQYVRTMPIKKESIIMSKYLLIVIMTAIGLIIAIPVMLIIGDSFFNIIYAVLINIIAVMLVLTIMIPAAIKLGRNILSIMIIIILAGQAFFMFNNKKGLPINCLENINGDKLMLGLFIIVVIGIIISYRISVNFYKKKNF